MCVVTYTYNSHTHRHQDVSNKRKHSSKGGQVQRYTLLMVMRCMSPEEYLGSPPAFCLSDIFSTFCRALPGWQEAAKDLHDGERGAATLRLCTSHELRLHQTICIPSRIVSTISSLNFQVGNGQRKTPSTTKQVQPYTILPNLEVPVSTQHLCVLQCQRWFQLDFPHPRLVAGSERGQVEENRWNTRLNLGRLAARSLCLCSTLASLTFVRFLQAHDVDR